MEGRLLLDEGLAAFRSRSWATAFERLGAADREGILDADGLVAFAHAAYLSGHSDACVDVLGRAYQAFAHAGDLGRAAGCAYWLAFALLNRGDGAQANGWINRALGLLDEGEVACVERGYLEMLLGIQRLMQGDPAGALTAIDAVAAAARQYGDADLTGLSSLGRGQALIALERTEEGLDLLDQVMVAAIAGELSEAVAGLAYCAVIAVCQDILDVRRAREWTAALSRWCAEQPELVPYSGHCLVHRSEIEQLHGDWEAARETAAAAHERYVRGGDDRSRGLAFYRQAELLRLRGDYSAADELYTEASRRGIDPQPGLTLLRLAQGDHEAAATSSRRLLAEPLDRLRRARMLAVHVEVMLGVGDVSSAAEAADELTATAASFAPSMLRAVALHGHGGVRLAKGDAAGALAALRSAVDLWGELDAPYELARTREQLGRACQALGDDGGAALELDAAAASYAALGAAPDVARATSPSIAAADDAGPTTGGLTPRELEVLRLVAAGLTNRAIAARLVLSEKTVARHLSNIYVKLDLPSRAAATAYAYEHSLV